MRKKASGIESARRVHQIQGMITSGVPDYKILYFAQTTWNISERQAKRYLQKAYQNWKVDCEASIEEQRAAKIAELQELKNSLQESSKKTPQGLQVILNIQKEIIKLQDLMPAKKVILQGDAEKPIVITDDFSEDHQKRLQNLLEKASKVFK